MTTTSRLTVIIGAPASFFALQATGGVPPYTWSATPPDSLLDFPIPVTPSGIVTRDISVDQFGVAHPGLTPSTSEFRLPGGDDLYAMRADMPAVIRARFTVTDAQGATAQVALPWIPDSNVGISNLDNPVPTGPTLMSRNGHMVGSYHPSRQPAIREFDAAGVPHRVTASWETVTRMPWGRPANVFIESFLLVRLPSNALGPWNPSQPLATQHGCHLMAPPSRPTTARQRAPYVLSTRQQGSNDDRAISLEVGRTCRFEQVGSPSTHQHSSSRVARGKGRDRAGFRDPTP